MTIATGQNINASDFINTSAGAGDASKGVKLDSAGKINANMKKKFGCKVYQNAGTAFSAGGTTYMSFQVEEFDDDTMHSTVSNVTRITFTTAGYYLVGGSATGGNGSLTTMGCGIRLNGTTIIASGGGADNSGAGRGVHTSVVRHFNAADYIEFGASANSATSSSGDEGTNFWAILLQKD
jgi:hypothetical protein